MRFIPDLWGNGSAVQTQETLTGGVVFALLLALIMVLAIISAVRHDRERKAAEARLDNVASRQHSDSLETELDR